MRYPPAFTFLIAGAKEVRDHTPVQFIIKNTTKL